MWIQLIAKQVNGLMKKTLVLAVLTGILFALSFPPFRSGFIAYGALIPFFYLLNNRSFKETIRLGYLSGFFIHLTTLFWVGNVTMPGVAGMLLILPLFTMLYGVLHRLVLLRLPRTGFVFLPFVWTAVEYLQSFGETAFPWIYLGYTQTYYLPVIQFAEYTSVFGVTFWVFSLNIILYHLLFGFSEKPNRKLWLIIWMVLFLLPFGFGLSTSARLQNDSDSVRIALIQGNIDPFEKWNSANTERQFVLYDSLTREALSSNPDLVIWPETAMPFYLRYEYRYLRRIRQLIDTSDVVLLTGSIDLSSDEGEHRYYNAALQLRPDEEKINSYGKRKLVPFSERVPYSDFFPISSLRDWLMETSLGVGDYSRGAEYTLFYLTSDSCAQASADSGFAFAVPICYESTFPELVRQFVKRGADFLVVITNDAWFGRTSAPYQHQQIAVMRAIETRRSIARCANTGISCFIDPYGRVSQRSRLFRQAVLVGDVKVTQRQTFFVRHGNLFSQFTSLLSVLVVLFAIAKGTSKRGYR